MDQSRQDTGGERQRALSLLGWPKMLVLHPLQSPDAKHSYAPYSVMINGWALDPLGTCRVELWHDGVLLGAVMADQPVDHETARAQGEEHYVPACGWSFIPSLFQHEKAGPVSFTIRVIAQDGRASEYCVEYAHNLSSESERIRVAAKDRENISYQIFLSHAFRNLPVTFTYVFHRGFGNVTTAEEMADCERQARRIANFPLMVERRFYVLSNDDSTSIAALPLLAGKIASPKDLKTSVRDFVLLQDVELKPAYDEELRAVSAAISDASPGPAGTITLARRTIGTSLVGLCGDFIEDIELPLPSSLGEPSVAPSYGANRIDSSDRSSFSFAHVNGPLCDYSRIRSIVVLKLDAIGDVISAVPALRLLRSTFPNARITLLVAQVSFEVVKSLNLTDETLMFETYSPDDGRRWDLAIDLRLDVDTRNVLLSLPASLRVALYPSEQRHRMPPVGALGIHMTKPEDAGGSESQFLPSSLLFDTGQIPERFHSGRQHRQTVSEQLYGAISRLKKNMDGFFQDPHPCDTRALPDELRDTGRYCVIAPGHGNDVRSPRAAFFVELAKRVAHRFGLTICVLGSSAAVRVHSGAQEPDSEAAHCETITNLLKSHGVPAVKLLDLSGDAFVATIGAASFFIGIDSGPKHMACLLGVPGLSLHSGRHTPNVWGPSAPFMISVYAPTVCSPCILFRKADCHNSMLCLENLSIDQAWEAAKLAEAATAWRHKALSSS